MTLAFCLFSTLSYAQETKPQFDGHAWKAPYHLSIPRDWTIERFLLPAPFAPEIKYKGVEDIRFSPGWSKHGSEEYWSYAFLWYLEEQPSHSKKIVESNLRSYYTGLTKANTDPTKTKQLVLKPATTKFKKSNTLPNGLATYRGWINMTDYMTGKPLKLNCLVHYKSCRETGKALVFYQLSPKAFDHKVWKTLDKLWDEFRCKKIE